MREAAQLCHSAGSPVPARAGEAVCVKDKKEYLASKTSPDGSLSAVTPGGEVGTAKERPNLSSLRMLLMSPDLTPTRSPAGGHTNISENDYSVT